MTDAIVPQLTARFDELSQRLPDEGIEFWFARDLMEPLGYARWENFITAIHRAIGSCKSTDYDEPDHFRGVTKMVRLGQRNIKPEKLPAEEDTKKLERRVKSDEKKLEKQSGKLPRPDSEN
ncbi:MAG: hypothetical protein KBD39_09170 [Sterolibacterium sp.]|nr:hypothetical protein [Sterolibacterium sp.]